MKSISGEQRNLLEKVMPEKFNFYDHGSVIHGRAEEDQKDIDLSDDLFVHRFAIHGDLNATILVSFPIEADESMYAEVGNVLVSRVCSGLAKEAGMDVMISPPSHLNSFQVAQYVHIIHEREVMHRRYFHMYGKFLVPVDIIVIPDQEVVGHA